MTTELTPEEQSDRVHNVFAGLAGQRGRPAPYQRRLDIQDPISDDGETDCWTHAWDYARELKARGVKCRYVEGICFRPARKAWATHAWVEVDYPLTGPTVVELTEGYEEATSYRGFTIEQEHYDYLPLIEGQPRVSVLQLLLFYDDHIGVQRITLS